MSVPTAQLLSDRDRQFGDWGETITFREYTRTVDPQTQQVTEVEQETELLAIVGSELSSPTRQSSSRHLTDKISFLIKTEDLPTSNPAATSRIIYNGSEYDVLKFQLSARGLVYMLDCRKTS